ncbi:MAG: U32 family peptidase [Clostridia bacterium]|nr:U32 family peptidase [Clostridia bacterium]
MIELLAPAGNVESFYAAVNNGANAVYLGLKNFSARKNADNFTEDELVKAIGYAKVMGVKVYCALNTLVKQVELKDFFSALTKAVSLGINAIILQDIFIGKLIKEKLPNVELHLSTQAGINNV